MEMKFGDQEWDLNDPVTVYSCTVTSCNFTTRCKLLHKGSTDNSKVKALSFKNTTVHYIPRGLPTLFPNLSFLLIENCGLKEVSAADMVGLGKLEVFRAPYNKIATLPVELFKKTPILKDVSFKRNSIQNFDARILEPIKDTIEVFNILRNPGIDKVYRKISKIEDFIEGLKATKCSKKKSTRLENLFTSSKHSDFTIKVQEKEYRVHKCILSSMSSVFDTMFSTEPSLASKQFEHVSNVSYAAIEEFLRYFYTRATPSEENVVDLLEMAVKFDVPDLKQQCEIISAETICPENAQEMYKVAERLCLKELKRKAFAAIRRSLIIFSTSRNSSPQTSKPNTSTRRRKSNWKRRNRAAKEKVFLAVIKL